MKNYPFTYSKAAYIAFCCCLWTAPSTAQTDPRDNTIAQTITFRSIPTGTSLAGVFEGRPPCRMIRSWQLPIDKVCEKIKTELTLYRDPKSLQPSTYTIFFVGAGELIMQGGGSYRGATVTGKWAITKGMPGHPTAILYRLETSKPGTYCWLLKGDDNVLFILDENKAFLTGNEDFSYTLNRVELVAGKNDAGIHANPNE